MWRVCSTILLVFAPSYAAAAVVASCAPGFSWTYNSQGQSPCYITSALLDVCVPTADPVPSLPSLKYHYNGPTVENRNECQCNSVFYSMLSACAVCQGGETGSWSDYKTNCTKVFMQTFPAPLPVGVPVPHYAYLDVAAINGFDPSSAQAARGSESVGLPSATTTDRQTAGQKSNGGAIAGGVVGGLALLGIVVAVVVWLLLRPGRASPTVVPQYSAHMSYASSLTPSKQQQSHSSFREMFSGNQPVYMQPSSSPQQPFHPGMLQDGVHL